MMEIKMIKDPISLKELQEVANERYGDMVKAVIDVDINIMAIGGEMHADEEAIMLENGSKQENLWGINLYPADFGADNFIEYDSMINIRPNQDNRSRSVESEDVKKMIIEKINNLIKNE